MEQVFLIIITIAILIMLVAGVIGSVMYNNYYMYRGFPNMDVSGHDIVRLKGANIPTLMTACNTMPNCKAFTNEGYLKGGKDPFPPQDKWKSGATGSLFVKPAYITGQPPKEKFGYGYGY